MRRLVVGEKLQSEQWAEKILAATSLRYLRTVQQHFFVLLLQPVTIATELA
jgi:hypothetical protein